MENGCWKCPGSCQAVCRDTEVVRGYEVQHRVGARVFLLILWTQLQCCFILVSAYICLNSSDFSRIKTRNVKDVDDDDDDDDDSASRSVCRPASTIQPITEKGTSTATNKSGSVIDLALIN